MMVRRLLFVIFLLTSDVYCLLRLGNLITVPSNTFFNVSELVTARGYPVEEYTVQTPDGYLLTIQRIPYGKRDSGIGNKPVVLLIHGLAFDSSQWVLNDEKMSLAFVLADNGYDVWLGNNRGNIYARRNVRLSAAQNEFWDFSFDEMAKYDQPSMIDFILDKTGQEQLTYIGYSQGTSIAFALLSQSPYYSEKIKFFLALAPVTQTVYTAGILAPIATLALLLQPVYKQIGLVRLVPHNRFIELFSVFVCGTSLRFICAELFFAAVGYDREQLIYARLPTYYNHLLSGTSFKEFLHYAQLRFAGRFQKYDYRERNLEVYNQISPPEYDLSKITVPVALVSGSNDVLADPRDVDATQSLLNTVVERYIVPGFNHGDFAVANDAYQLLNVEVLSLLERYG